MKELPEFTVIQLHCHYPDDTIMDSIRRTSEEMARDSWNGVGVIHSMAGDAIYLIYEKRNESEEMEDDNLQGVAQQA